MESAAHTGSDRVSRQGGDAGAPPRAISCHQHALVQESIPASAEKRGPLPRAAQRSIRACARCRCHRRGADDRAKLAAGARLAVAQSPANSREAARRSVAAPGFRPRTRGVVPLNLAILGTRGVPPHYGGFETFAAELGTRLVA